MLQALGSYVKEVLERCRFFQEWIDEGPPTIYWLSGFFFTQVSVAKDQHDSKAKIGIIPLTFKRVYRMLMKQQGYT